MTRSSLLLALFLAGCATSSTVFIRPDIPPLPAAVAADCQEAKPIKDDSIAALIGDDADVRAALVDCRLRHRAGVEAYEAMRAKVNAKAPAAHSP